MGGGLLGWWVRGCGWVGAGSVWFVCVCGLRFVVCGVVVVGGGCACGWCVVCVDFELYLGMIDLCGKHSQVEILAGAAQSLNDDRGVRRCAECVEKSPVDQKGKRLLDFHMFITKTVRASICDVVLSSTRRQDDPSYLSSRSCVEGQHGHRVVVLRTTPHRTCHC